MAEEKTKKTALDVDKNMQSAGVVADGLRTFVMPCEPFDLYGVKFDEQEGGFYRVPEAVAVTSNEGVTVLRRNTAGGRIRFRTDSSVIRLKATYGYVCDMNHMPLTGSSGFVLVEKRNGVFVHVASMRPEHFETQGFERTEPLKGGEMREYVLYFPLYNDVDTLTLGFDETAKIEHGERYKIEKPIVYYGSSITQGGCASRADASYQALVSKWLDADYVNLGFSGSARAETSMAKFVADVDASVFVMDYDHNAPTPEYLAETHFRFYKTYRARRPETPIVFVTKPDIEHDAFSADRAAIVRATFDRAKEEGDENVYFINGGEFFPETERGNCTVDGCHPTDLGFYFMAKRVREVVEPLLK